MSDCSLRSRGSRFEAAAFLSHSQTKSMSARSFVQDSGARSWALRIRRRRRRSQRKERLCSLLLRAAALDSRLRSRRCSLGCRRLRRICRNVKRRSAISLLHTARRWGWCSLGSRNLLGDRRREHPLVDETERPNRVTLLDEFGHTGVDLAAGKVIDVQPRHDLVCAAGYRACE